MNSFKNLHHMIRQLYSSIGSTFQSVTFPIIDLYHPTFSPITWKPISTNVLPQIHLPTELHYSWRFCITIASKLTITCVTCLLNNLWSDVNLCIVMFHHLPGYRQYKSCLRLNCGVVEDQYLHSYLLFHRIWRASVNGKC